MKEICRNCEHYYDPDPTLKEEPEFCKRWNKSKRPTESCGAFLEWKSSIQTQLGG